MIALELNSATEMVFSATSASEGAQHSLGYIPGQALWGALAARIYADPTLRARAFNLVHSGGLRISPGFPLGASKQPAFPWPQCLQNPKHEPNSTRIWNTLDGALMEPARVQTEPPKSLSGII